MGILPSGARAGIFRSIPRALARLLGLLLGRGPDLGRRGEEAAARHLARQGLRILARNFRSRTGEIDIVAADGRTLVLVEVKSVLSGGRDPLGKIDRAKARRIRRAAALCRRWTGQAFEACRIDGVVVEFDRGSRGRPVARSVRWYPSLHPVEEDGGD